MLFGGRPQLALLVGTTVGLLLAGCAQEEAPFEPEQPKQIAFDGEIKPELVGLWSTKGDISSMDLKEDGSAKMINKAVGRGASEVDGRWKAQAEKLLIETNGTNGPVVVSYGYVLKGDSLQITQKAAKLDVQYLRQRPKK
jgi:hypothetical protein